MADVIPQIIDDWLNAHNLNKYGDPHGTMYAGGTPLFNETTGVEKTRLQHLNEKFPNKPWEQKK